jgi:hypothetical protein
VFIDAPVQQAKTELAGISRKLKQMKTQVAVLEERKSKLVADIEERRRHP